MFPISDEPDPNAHGPAIITLLIILANIAVFVLLQQLGHNDAFTYAFAMVPHEVLSGHDIAEKVTLLDPLTGVSGGSIQLQHTPIPVWATIFTSMFMHGGFMHLFGNMLFLWIFGDNLEHAMGSIKFLFFYLLCGTVAAAAQIAATVASGANDFIPMLGASGAISGVLGGYLVLFPTRRVNVLLWYFITAVPAWVALGMWFVFQLVSGLGVFGSDTQVGGVAYAAHIGGFVAGLLLVRLFANQAEAVSNLHSYYRQRRGARF
jgi:membrane associated rhomboid family serine protease